MVDEDIHSIWKVFGEGGLIQKIGPDRTIRELKKRCDAGAIIGCTMYKLLIDQWIDVSIRAKDQGERAPAEEFMLSAGEDELVAKIEALHEQYPDGIPRSVWFDLKDEWNSGFIKKVGRNVPLDPKEASKKDIEESKRIALQLGGVEQAPTVKPVIPKPEEKPLPKPETVPLPKSPEQPVKVSAPTLDLMEKEIRERMDKLRKKKAAGELEAGEKKSIYDPYTMTDAQIVKLFSDAIAGADLQIRTKATTFTTNQKRKLIEIAFSTGPDVIKLIEIYGTEEYNRIERIKNQYKKGAAVSKLEIAKCITATVAPPHEIEPGKTPAICPGIPGFEMCKYCQFRYTVTLISLCPYKPEFKGTFKDSDIKYIVGIVARETGESETTLSKSFQEYIKRIGQIKNIDSLPDLKSYYDNVDGIQVLSDYHKLELKRFIIQRMQQIIDYYEKGKPTFPDQFRENSTERKNEDVIQEPRDYSQWTFADFEGLIQGLEDIEDLEELYEYIDASDKLSDPDRITLRNLVKTRIDELAAGYSELSKIRG